MSFYIAPSGAKVFATGSTQRIGVDPYMQNRVSPAAQQTTCNVLNAFGAVSHSSLQLSMTTADIH